jgi:cleavage stimulation factor subunit 2
LTDSTTHLYATATTSLPQYFQIMWAGGSSNPMGHYGHQPAPPTLGGAPPIPPPTASTASSGQKHDVFVGNLAFSTTEEQLYTAFSELGRIVKVRMVSDNDTGKPRGFAFIEFEDPQAALSAIRNMNDYEINGRRIRVNFSNSSHLETLAGQLGMDLSNVKKEETLVDKSQPIGGGGASDGVAGSKAVASALKSLNKGEMYDVVAKLKEVADSNPEEARKLLTQHPQLPEAILYCMSEVRVDEMLLIGECNLDWYLLALCVAVQLYAPQLPPLPSARHDQNTHRNVLHRPTRSTSKHVHPSTLRSTHDCSPTTHRYAIRSTCSSRRSTSRS